jgi:hypothetical protein
MSHKRCEVNFRDKNLTIQNKPKGHSLPKDINGQYSCRTAVMKPSFAMQMSTSSVAHTLNDLLQLVLTFEKAALLHQKYHFHDIYIVPKGHLLYEMMLMHWYWN